MTLACIRHSCMALFVAGGSAAVLAQPLDLGACCQGGSVCTLTEEAACIHEGHSWLGANTTCTQCPPLPSCPVSGVLMSHPPFDPLAEPSAYTSEITSSFRISENFTGVTGPVTALTWWGLDLRKVGNGFVECTESDPTFNITVSEDAAGAPGSLVCSYTLLATRTPTGHTFHGFQLNEYHLELPTSCILTRGWVSIAGAGDPSCWFLWMTSPTGDHRAHCTGCGTPTVEVDFAVCLHGTPGGVFGACCSDAAGTCNDSVAMNNCAADNQRFLGNGTCSSLDPPCGVIIGACCFAQFNCNGTTQLDCATQGGLWLGANSQCGACPCIVGCPIGGRAEAEPMCVTGYVDHFNAGCASTPHHFMPVSLGETICGVAGFYQTGVNYLPDQDWYEMQIPVAMGWSVQVTAELPLRVEVREAGEGCPGQLLASNQSAATCLSSSFGVFSGNPGTHWIVVSAFVANDQSACGAKYTLEIVSPYGCILGDLNQDFSVNGIDMQAFTDCVTNSSTPFNCFCGDMNFDGLFNSADVPLFVSRLLQG